MTTAMQLGRKVAQANMKKQASVPSFILSRLAGLARGTAGGALRGAEAGAAAGAKAFGGGKVMGNIGRAAGAAIQAPIQALKGGAKGLITGKAAPLPQGITSPFREAAVEAKDAYKGMRSAGGSPARAAQHYAKTQGPGLIAPAVTAAGGLGGLYAAGQGVASAAPYASDKVSDGYQYAKGKMNPNSLRSQRDRYSPWLASR